MQQDHRPRAYVAVISRESPGNWAVCREQGLWGFTERAARNLGRAVGPGDLIWFYVAGRGFVALSEILGEPEPLPDRAETPWNDGRLYASTVRIRFIADLPTAIRPDFPRTSGYKFDPMLKIGTNHLLAGFFRITPDQHAALVSRSQDVIPTDYRAAAAHR